MEKAKLGEWYFFTPCKSKTCGKPVLIAADPSHGKVKWLGPGTYSTVCPHCSSPLQYVGAEVQSGPIVRTQ